MKIEVDREERCVVVRLTAQEAAWLANDCRYLASGSGEDPAAIELELRRAADSLEYRQ